MIAGLMVHAGLAHADAQGEQHEAEAAADEVAHAPAFDGRAEESAHDATDVGHMVGHVAGDHRAEDADGGDQRGPVAATLLGQRLGDERDAPAELAREAEAGDEAPRGVGFEAMHEAVGDVRHGIKQDGAEEGRQAAHAVAEDAEEDAAEQHAGHLPGKQVLIPGRAADEVPEPEAGQAVLADRHEQREVVDVDEVAERADDDGGLQQILPEGARRFRKNGGAHEGGVTPSDRADWPWKCQTTLPR